MTATLLILKDDGSWSDATISANERAFHYGDGLFETMRVRRGKVRFLPHHWQRLCQDAVRLALPPPSSAWRNALKERAAQYNDAIFKIIYSRGASGRGYATPPDITPSFFLSISPYDAERMQQLALGVAVRYGAWQLQSHPFFGGMKHLNRLEQVMARREWRDDAIFESLLTDKHGRIIEGVMSNLFIVKSDQLLTPSLHEQGVAGVMRRVVMECAPCTESSLTKDDIDASDEIFLTNALIGVVPVIRLEERSLPIGDVTKKLMARIDALSP